MSDGSTGAARRWRRRPCRAAAPIATLLACLGVCGSAIAAQRFQADEWITECTADNCSITVPFWQSGTTGKGSFALVVMVRSGNIGIVGSPSPAKAVLRIDKNPPATCQGERYCIFPAAQSLAAVKELDTASLILIDVFSGKGRFSFSLSPKGYQAGLAQIRAWGYQLGAD